MFLYKRKFDLQSLSLMHLLHIITLAFLKYNIQNVLFFFVVIELFILILTVLSGRLLYINRKILFLFMYLDNPLFIVKKKDLLSLKVVKKKTSRETYLGEGSYSYSQPKHFYILVAVVKYRKNYIIDDFDSIKDADLTKKILEKKLRVM